MDETKEVIKKPIHFDMVVWENLQKQAEKHSTTPSKAIDYILRNYYKINK